MGPAKPRTAEQVRSELTAAMVRPESCFLNNPDYAIRDADFLDQALSRLLNGRTLEDVGGDAQEFDELVKSAPDREDDPEWRYEYRRATDRVKVVFNGEKSLSILRMTATKAER